MDKATNACLQEKYRGLTIAQRENLKAIVEGRQARLIEPVCESLVDVGLLRRSGDRFVATDAGLFVVTLF